MGNQKTQLLQKENAEPLKSGKKTADAKKSGKRASAKPLNVPGKGFGSLSDIPLTPENILFLQRTIGNRATTKLVQAKLKIGQPGDEYEREADQVAEQVMRMPETSPALQMKPASSLGMVQRQSMDEEEKRKRMEEEGTVSAKENPGQTPAISPKVESQIDGMRGGGEQLPESVRTHFEPRFGQDFSEVRVHKDAPAAESAQAINARAYTTGRDIVFGSGEYAPETGEGKRLLAHELTHVVQQEALPSHIQRVVSLTDDDYAAMAEQLYEAMKGWGTDEEAIYVALQKLEKDAAAIEKLKKAYKDKYKKDLEAEIHSEMSGEELRLALDLIGIKAETKKEEMVGGTPATDDEYKTAAKKLYAAMKDWGTDEEAIYAVLIPFKRDSTKLQKLKDTYNSELSGGLTGKGLEADIKDEMSSDELAYALYLMNAPPPATTPVAEAVVTIPGTEEHKAKVAGGEVSVRTGVSYTPAAGGPVRVGGFAIGYEGGLAAESRWLQFIQSEVLTTQPDGSVKYVAESGLPTSNGTMELTTDPSAPNYKVDSGSASSPFYEAGSRDVRTTTGTTIYDRPQEFTDVIHRQFDAGATKVVERDYFDTFLIRDYKTIYRVTVVVEWVYTSKTSVTRTTKFQSGSKVDSMPAAMRKQLVKEYPKFEFIQ